MSLITQSKSHAKWLDFDPAKVNFCVTMQKIKFHKILIKIKWFIAEIIIPELF